MKKVICLALSLIISLSLYSVSLADGFSVRGNVNFITTKQDILAYEQSAGSEIQENKVGDNLSNYYTDNCIVCDGISYAGYDNCRVIYYFDKNDNLISILYVVRFFGDSGAKNVPDAYTRLDNALNDKYGTIIDNPISFTKDEKAYGVVEFIKGLGIFGSATNFKQRLADNETAFIEIEIAKVEYIDNDAMKDISKVEYADVRGIAISYTQIANEVVYDLYQQAEDAQNALDSDL